MLRTHDSTVGLKRCIQQYSEDMRPDCRRGAYACMENVIQALEVSYVVLLKESKDRFFTKVKLKITYTHFL